MKRKNSKYIKVWLLMSIMSSFSLALPAPVEKNNTEPTPHLPYSLNQLIALANTNNLLIKIADIDKEIAAAEYRDLRALPNPELEYARGKGELPDDPVKPSLWELGLKWSMPNPLYRHFLLRSQKTHLTEAEILAEINKRNIIKDLKTHYFRLRFSSKIKTFAEEKLQRLEEVNQMTKAKVSIGEAKEIDYLRSSVEIQKCKTDLFRFLKIISYEKTKVNEFLNYQLPGDFTVEEDFTFTPLPDIETRVNQLIEASPLIRLKLNRLNREKENLKSAGFSIIEEIQLFGSREKELDGKTWKLGLGISVPLFNRKSAQIEKARLEKQKARLDYDHERKHFYADVQRIIAEIRVLEKEIETFSTALLTEGKENMALSETLYKEGEVPLVVYLDSQDSYIEIQGRYYEAITEWNILTAELQALLGGEL